MKIKKVKGCCYMWKALDKAKKNGLPCLEIKLENRRVIATRNSKDSTLFLFKNYGKGENGIHYISGTPIVLTDEAMEAMISLWMDQKGNR